MTAQVMVKLFSSIYRRVFVYTTNVVVYLSHACKRRVLCAFLQKKADHVCGHQLICFGNGHWLKGNNLSPKMF